MSKASGEKSPPMSPSHPEANPGEQILSLGSLLSTGIGPINTLNNSV